MERPGKIEALMKFEVQIKEINEQRRLAKKEFPYNESSLPQKPSDLFQCQRRKSSKYKK